MHITSKFLPLALAAFSAAAPAAVEVDKRAGTAYTDGFDDLQTSVVTPQLFPVGLYHGIKYGGVVVLQPIPGAADILPHSPKQQAGAAGPIDLLQLGTLTLNTYAQLVRGPGVSSFDLQSFWFGLATDTGTTEGIAQGGTIALVAYDVKGNQLPTVSFSYAPKGTQNQPLVYAQLPSTWKNLQNVSIGVADSEPVAERTYIGLDDVKHVNYS